MVFWVYQEDDNQSGIEHSKHFIMQVVKRNGKKEPVFFDKITERIQRLKDDPRLPKLSDVVDPVLIAKQVIGGLCDGVTTMELDTHASEFCAHLSPSHPAYAVLASRIAVSNLQKHIGFVIWKDEQAKDPDVKNSPLSFTRVAQCLFNQFNPRTKAKAPLINEQVYNCSKQYEEWITSVIDPYRDYQKDLFGLNTLLKGYLLKVHMKSNLEGTNLDEEKWVREVVETPQFHLMRVAIGVHGKDLGLNPDLTKEQIDKILFNIKKSYDLTSNGVFTYATPTLFNAGTPLPQMSSCFLATMKADSIEGIYSTLKWTALLSKYAGGLGINVCKIRASESYIAGTNGESNGLVPMLRVFNDTARYVDQGGGKRKGSFAIYIEPWHADIEDWLDLKLNSGKEERRCRDLFFGLWNPDLLMKRAEEGGMWSLFCPHEAPGLNEVWGEEFEALYLKYENTKGLARKKIKAQDLMTHIAKVQIETGTPYMMFKDSVNAKNAQSNTAVITQSNLCTEILLPTSPEEVACCNLCSISLPKCLKVDQDGKKYFDHQMLMEVSMFVNLSLNEVIDRNFYPLPETKLSNMRHRPVAVGVQGLADVFHELGLSWESQEAKILNQDIFETIYYGSLKQSNLLAQEFGPYSTFAGSPASKGILQFDMWEGVKPRIWTKEWDSLKADIVKHGVRNAVVVAPMPTASTSQILGNTECFEPLTSNIYKRRVLSGEFTVVNARLIHYLESKGLWNEDIKDQIIKNNGSVQQLDLPQDVKDIYKTAWEVDLKTIIDMAADRGAYIDQNQSLNLFMVDPTVPKVTSMYNYAWKKKIKGCYYLRTRGSAKAAQIDTRKSSFKGMFDKGKTDQSKKRSLDEENLQEPRKSVKENEIIQESSLGVSTTRSDSMELNTSSSNQGCSLRKRKLLDFNNDNELEASQDAAYKDSNPDCCGS
jgi:ribonucleoside-diphosphate reductase alpha chain